MVAKIAKIARPAVRELVAHVAQLRPGANGPEATAQVLSALGAGTLAEVLDRPSAPLEWVGSAAPDGIATPDEIRAALEQHTLPDGSSTAGRRGGSQNSWGIVFSDPKSCSLLLAHPDEKVREALEHAHALSIKSAMQMLEDLATCRTGDGGEAGGPRSLKTTAVTGLVGAQVSHTSSSFGDPSKHTHVLLSGMALCEDGQFRSLNTEALLPLMRLVEAERLRVYQASLSQALGLKPEDWTYTEVGPIRVPEIKALMGQSEQLSQASTHVAECAAQLGIVLGSRTLEQDALAYRRHRAERGDLSEAIEHAVDAAYATDSGRAALRHVWEQRAPGLADTLAEIRPASELTAAPAQPVKLTPIARAAAAERAMEWAERQSVWSWADLAARLKSDPEANLSHRQAALMAAKIIDGLGERGDVVAPTSMREQVRALWDRESQDADALRDSVRTQALCTTKVALDAENHIRQQAQRLATTQRRALLVEPTEGSTPEQIMAISAMGRGRALVTVTGVAGAGKSHSLAPVAEAARRAGLRVVCTARNAATAQDTGTSIGAAAADTRSLAALLSRPDLPAGPCLLVVDEGGVIDRADWHELMRRVEARPDVQVVALGDRGQAQSIDRSGAWHVVTEGTLAGDQAVTLSKSYRCQAWAQQHDALRAGNAEAVLTMAGDRLVAATETNWAAQAARRVVDEPGTLALVMSNAEAAEISRKVQEARGTIGTVPCSGDAYLGAGDRVRTRKNDRKLRVLNGQTWTVETATTEAVTLLNERGRRVTLPADYVRQSVELDYAATLDSAQGRTVDRALVVCRDGLGLSGLYSAATRGRQSPVLLAVGEENADPSALLTRIITTRDEAPTVAEHAERIRHAAAAQEEAWNNYGSEVSTAEPEPAPTPEPPKPPRPAILNGLKPGAYARRPSPPATKPILTIVPRSEPQPEPEAADELIDEPAPEPEPESPFGLSYG